MRKKILNSRSIPAPVVWALTLVGAIVFSLVLLPPLWFDSGISESVVGVGQAATSEQPAQAAPVLMQTVGAGATTLSGPESGESEAGAEPSVPDAGALAQNEGNEPASAGATNDSADDNVASSPPEDEVDAGSRRAEVLTPSNLRAGPGTNYDIVGGASPGDIVMVVDTNEAGDWYRLESGEWIAEFLVEIMEPVSVAPAPAVSTSSDATATTATDTLASSPPPAGPGPTTLEDAPSAPLSASLPPHVALDGFRHMWQTFNNCGPATLAMNLSYYGSPLGQAEVGAAIRRHAEDKNVNAAELAEYARQQGFIAQARVNGDRDLMRRFISQGIPVLIETWLEDNPGDYANGFGHYRLLTGYDDANQRWIAHDSYVRANLVNGDPNAYAGIYLDYAETDRLWTVYNYTYILIYPPDRADVVAEILGDQADPTVMWESALARAETALAQQQAQGSVSVFSWFNLGSALYHVGRAEEAAHAFDQARAIGLPWRMLWYQFEPFAAYHAVGRYQDVVDLARTTLSTVRELEEVQYWYGMGLAGLGNTDGARQAWTYALQMHPGLEEARVALEGLGN